MKNKFVLIFIILIASILLVGCNKKSDGSFRMTCTTKVEKEDGMETQTIIYYKFNKEQLVTEYVSETTQKFEKDKVYKEYKKAQEKASKNSSGKNIKIEVKSDDKNKKLVYSMTIKNLNKEAKTDEEKTLIRASKVIETNKQRHATCKLEGISKSKLK